jgi:hypothetical protein
LVIHSLYSHKDVFLRELLSNANDALEKLRLTSLTDRDVMKAGEANVTIEVRLDEGGKTGELTIRGQCLIMATTADDGRADQVDTGIGMTKEELAKNLGTIARSGTSEFLKHAEEGGGADGNLIGQFGELRIRPLHHPRSSSSRSRFLLLLPSLTHRPRLIPPSCNVRQPKPYPAHLRLFGLWRFVRGLP